MKKILIIWGILVIAVLLVGCGNKTEPVPLDVNEQVAGESTPIDKDIADLDSELDVDIVGTDLDSLDKDLDNL